jgi:polyhydroxyalkanoate synthase
MTLLTTLTDFNDPGELAVFIDPSEVSYLEDLMWEQGYLDPQQAAGSFQLLRSHDLIWSKMVPKSSGKTVPPMMGNPNNNRVVPSEI